MAVLALSVVPIHAASGSPNEILFDDVPVGTVQSLKISGLLRPYYLKYRVVRTDLELIRRLIEKARQADTPESADPIFIEFFDDREAYVRVESASVVSLEDAYGTLYAGAYIEKLAFLKIEENQFIPAESAFETFGFVTIEPNEQVTGIFSTSKWRVSLRPIPDSPYQLLIDLNLGEMPHEM